MSEWVAGRHAVFHLLSAGRRKALKLYLQKGAQESEKALTELARKQRVPLQVVESSFFVSRFGAGATHQGVAVEAEAYPYADLEDLIAEPTLLILDEIQDPQNLGALCRSAYVLGVGGVVIPENRAASITSGTCQASVGAVEYLKVARFPSIAKALEILKKNEYWIYGADVAAPKSVFEEDFAAKVALVIGNEEKGLRKLVRETCDFLVKIPAERHEIDSLNASVSGGILISEILRQRLQKLKKTDRNY
ncbi:MAG TPA: 23S rRNA (guanosine(2251)-2'-O)-methyltransferase RlmB [bacterium]|nr:23S rRNA (guanosine(2251)-2'-O)-methyltransferase RlmB [bacterium]